MVENKEVKIAIVVGIIMITICLLAFIFYKSGESKTNTIDIKIFKLYDKEGTEDEHEYRECSLTTDERITINSEYRKASKLSDSKKTKGQIKGNYKIMSGENYIAFDGDDSNLVYRSDSKGLYSFDSSIYEYVKKVCE